MNSGAAARDGPLAGGVGAMILSTSAFAPMRGAQ